MAACTSRGMVGSVYEVGPFTSKVMLLTDPDSRVGVVLENTRQTGILIGTNENKCRMIYLSINSEVKRGERVRTSGFGGMFPKDLEVGFVSDVKIDSIGFYKYAIVELSQDTNTIEEILCIE